MRLAKMPDMAVSLPVQATRNKPKLLDQVPLEASGATADLAINILPRMNRLYFGDNLKWLSD